MFTCSRCGKCCEMTEMEVSGADVERLERLGYSRVEFSILGKDGILRLRNIGNWCYFLDSENRLCRIYANRPLGCRLYPIVYMIDGWITTDSLCPEASKFGQDELRAKGRELINLLKTINNEAQARIKLSLNKGRSGQKD